MHACHVCGEPISESQRLDDPDAGHRMINVAPNAASGGTMKAVHNRCAPPLAFADQRWKGAIEAIAARLKTSQVCGRSQFRTILARFKIDLP